jgi:hypothetical protein
MAQYSSPLGPFLLANVPLQVSYNPAVLHDIGRFAHFPHTSRVLRVLDELRIITVCPRQSFEFDNHLLKLLEAVTAQKDTILVEACKSTVLVCLPRCTAKTSLSGSAMQVQKAEACLSGVFICCNECRCLGIWLY